MYIGPYVIVRAIELVNFVIQKSSRSKPFLVHMDKLKRCFCSTPTSWLNTGQNAEQAMESGCSDVNKSNGRTKEKSKLEVVISLPNDVIESDESKSDSELESNGRNKRVNRQRPERFNDYVL